MPTMNPEQLRKYVEEAANDPEIQAALQKINFDLEQWLSLLQNDETIWDLAARPLAEYEQVSGRVAEISHHVAAEEKTYLSKWRRWRFYVYTGSFVQFFTWFVLPCLLLGSILYYGYTNKFFDPVFSRKWLLVVVLIILAAGIGWLIMKVLISLRENAGLRKQAALDSFRKAKGLDQLNNLATEQRQLAVNLSTSIAELMIQGIRERLRLAINEQLKPDYELSLAGLSAKGLSEVLNESSVIVTRSHDELSFMLRHMHGGSIGIAGPRGAGKSTLIYSYCGQRSTINSINGLPILPVLSSAPVKYDAREYILHLFASTCQNVLKATGFGNYQSLTNILFEQEETPVERFNLKKIVGFVGRWAMPAALALLMVGVVIFLFERNYPSVPSNEKIIARFADSLVAHGVPAGGINEVRKNWSSQPSVWVEMIQAMNLKPGNFLLFGLLLFLVGYVVMADRILGRGISRLIRRNYLPSRRPARGLKPLDEFPPMARSALFWLRKIKFQQSFTTGWSGTLKLPAGLEGSMNKAQTLAENQMSNPEIITAFRDFVMELTSSYQVMIGIDELDKLEDEKSAHQFLNEIKSIFGMPKCFYLVSVSENAMSQFERRGLPFRDVFDSAFDNILYVHYLDLDAACTLLRKRVIGNPMPFFCLSYCFSGGLPRDLIRAFRQIVAARDLDGSLDNMAKLMHHIGLHEIKAKARAILHSLSNKHADLMDAHIVEAIYGIQHLSAFEELDGAILEITQWHRQYDDAEFGVSPITRYVDELLLFTDFMLLLADIFNQKLTKEKIAVLMDNGTFTKLATVRQSISVNVSIARTLLQSARTSSREKPV